MNLTRFSPTAIFTLGGVAIAALVLLISIPQIIEVLDAKHVMTIQYPNGNIETFTEPGPKMQWFGTVTKYERRASYEFDSDPACPKSSQGGHGYSAQKIRFAEGGHAFLCGKLQWEMPTKPDRLIAIQKDFSSQNAIEQSLVGPALTNAIYFSGQTMTSQESSAERRGELLSYIEDQLKNGVYRTVTRQERQIDPITKQERNITRVEIVIDKDGKPLRSNRSAIGEYGITLVQTSISEIKYEKEVEDQIKLQQQAQAAIKISIANATKAEQDARTAEEQGKANAATAKWLQEKIKATEVTKAEQEKAVATLNAEKERDVAKLAKDAAEFTKQEQILLGQGESERKRLVMSADGQLALKLETLKEINFRYADAIKGAQPHAWSPTVVMGAGASGSPNTAAALVDLLMAKTARDLAVDVRVK